MAEKIIQREAGNVRVVCAAFGLPVHFVKSQIGAGNLRSYCASRRTVILFEDVREFIRRLPPPVRPH